MKIRLASLFVVLGLGVGLVFGMGKSEGDKKKVAEPVQKTPAQPKSVQPAAPKTVEPVKPIEKAAPAVPATGMSANPVVATPAPAQTAAQPVPVDPARVFATVNGIKITGAETEPRVEMMVKQQIAQLGPMGASLPPQAFDNLKGRIRPQVVEWLVEQKLVEEKLKSKNIIITDEQIDTQLDAMLSARNMTREDAKKAVEQQGGTMEEFRSQMKMSMGTEKLLTEYMEGKSEPIDEADAKKFYDENQQAFQEAEQVKASHILIKTENLDEAGKAQARSRIEEILVKVKAGEDFATLAKEHSDCPSSAKGGDLDFFTKERMVPEFSEAAFSMKVGDVSGVVETKFGYHIIKVTDRKEAKVRSFEEEKDEITEYLTRQQRQRFWDQYRNELKKDAQIEYAEEIKQALQPKPQQVPVKPQTQEVPVKSGGN
ncbi:MAG: peptidylprolyl isomerase [Sedimentisphaerales bacterium]|nr:peptidylprolyl isomerase [Sedimentisphaerales bacterium]